MQIHSRQSNQNATHPPSPPPPINHKLRLTCNCLPSIFKTTQLKNTHIVARSSAVLQCVFNFVTTSVISPHWTDNLHPPTLYSVTLSWVLAKYARNASCCWGHRMCNVCKIFFSGWRRKVGVVELLTHCPAEIVAQQVMLSSEENKMHSDLHTYILCTKQSGAAQKRCTHT